LCKTADRSTFTLQDGKYILSAISLNCTIQEMLCNEEHTGKGPPFRQALRYSVVTIVLFLKGLCRVIQPD